MCLLVLQKQNSSFDWEKLEGGFDANPDGAGYAVHTPKGLIQSKGYFQWDAFRESLAPYEGRSCIVHFRISTSGNVDADNCHPFDVGGIFGRREFAGQLVVAHNGVLDERLTVPGRNDTWHFTKNKLYPVWKQCREFHLSEKATEAIGQNIGSSKLAFLDHLGRHSIVNERLGHWDKDVWYSNSSYAWSMPSSYRSYDDFDYGGVRWTSHDKQTNQAICDELTYNGVPWVEVMRAWGQGRDALIQLAEWELGTVYAYGPEDEYR